MTSKPLISVIIPVYNTKTTLKRCLDSVLTQSYQKLEIILVDDGSTDGASVLCDTLATQDTRIQVIHQKNQGLSAARNAGLKIAQGDYVTFVDSDDAIHLDLIETLYRLIRDCHTKLSICSFTKVFPDGHRQVFAQGVNQQLYSAPVALTQMLCENGFAMSAWGKLYARELFRNVKFPVGKLYEDVGTTYRLILQCDQVAFTPWSGYDYYQIPTSIVHQKFSQQKLDLIALTDQMRDEIAASPVLQEASKSERQMLEYALKKRRVHARFSILRQLTGGSTAEQHLRDELVSYIRIHAVDVLKNPLRSRRDVVATRAIQISPKLFLFLWNLHEKFHE